MMINAMYANLTKTSVQYHLTVTAPSTVSYGSQEVFTVQLTYSPGATPIYSPNLDLIMIDSQQLVAAIYPSNATIQSNPDQAPLQLPLALDHGVPINSTEITNLQNGDSAFSYPVPNNDLSEGSWEIFIFATSGYPTSPLTPIAWGATSFAADTPVKAVPVQVDEGVLANTIGLISTWFLVYQGTLSLERRVVAVPAQKWEWMKEHAPLTVGVTLLLVFLLLRYVVPIFF